MENSLKPSDESVRDGDVQKVEIPANGRPRPLIYIKDRQVVVETLKLSMSRKHRFVMFLDLWTIAWVSAITIGMSMSDSLSSYFWMIMPVGCLCTLISVCKTMIDFINWLYTMNEMNNNMGKWYVEDVRHIVVDLLNAGAKVAAEEVKKALEEKSKTEADDAANEHRT